MQLAETLRESERELRVLAGNVPALYSYVDGDGRYRFVNQRYEEWFGVPRERIIGRHLAEFVGTAAYERISGHVQQALLGQRVRFEDELPYKNGGTRWISAEYVPDTDGEGKVRGFFALVADITERKRAEEALRESEERFRLIARTTSDAIWDWDLVTGAVGRGEGMLTVFGHAPCPDDLEVAWWYKHIHPTIGLQSSAVRIRLSTARASSGPRSTVSGVPTAPTPTFRTVATSSVTAMAGRYG